jgi:hypothetical protein
MPGPAGATALAQPVFQLNRADPLWHLIAYVGPEAPRFWRRHDQCRPWSRTANGLPQAGAIAPAPAGMRYVPSCTRRAMRRSVGQDALRAVPRAGRRKCG